MIHNNKCGGCFSSSLTILFLFLIRIDIASAAGSCKVDLDCHKLNSCLNSQCIHKSFLPITFEELCGLFLLCISSLLANASGIGGGGLYVPILIMFNYFDFKDSIPLSKIMIFFGALTSFIYNIRYNSHPERKKGPQLDVTLIAYMIPFIVLGTQIGIAVNIILPELILLILMVMVLIFSTVKTTLNSIAKYREESNLLHSNYNPKSEQEMMDESNNNSLNSCSKPNSGEDNKEISIVKVISHKHFFENAQVDNNQIKEYVEMSAEFKKGSQLQTYEEEDEDSDDSLEDPEKSSLVIKNENWR